MKNYKVTMFNVVDGEPQFYSVNVACSDVATEVWLNPQFKNVYEVEEIYQKMSDSKNEMEEDTMLMTREYVIQTLKNEHLWEIGHYVTFEVMLSQKWEFTLRKEEEIYAPYNYALNGRKIGTYETWNRRYRSVEEAFLHIVNHLNEDADVKNKYDYIEDWLLDN